uniref:Uncharacterized protein n=1 Tax=Megaselia scalaris TaxID=36166 RepID=T1GSI2_MEGSC
MGAVGGVSFQDEVVQSARRGRFRVSAPAGPPETKLGRFRLMPSANYGPKSPILQRGRFAVILEEPQTQTPGTPPPEPIEDEGARRSPSPEWDFDEDVSFY